MKRCEWCDARLEDDELICPTCQREVREAPRAPAPPLDEPAVESSDASSPGSEPLAAPQVPNTSGAGLDAAPTASCPVHPDMPAPSTCSRCGRFVCIRCVPELATKTAGVICPECSQRADLAEAREELPKRMRGLPIGFAFYAAIYLAIGALTVAGGVRKHDDDLEFFGGIVSVIAIATIVSAVLLYVRKDLSFGWVAAVLLLLVPVTGMLMIGRGGGGGFCCFPFIGHLMWNLIKAHGYQRILKEGETRR